MTSDSKKTKAELIEELARLRRTVENNPLKSLFDAAPLPYQALDAQGNILAVNPAWLELTGYKRDSVVGRCFSDFLPYESLEAFKGRFSSFLAGNNACMAEFPFVKRDGSRIMVGVKGRIGHDDSGNFNQIHCILTDITEQKRTRDYLKSSERRFRGLFESNIDGVIYTDSQGSIITVNPAFCAMLDLESDDLLGKNILDITPENWHSLEKAVFGEQVSKVGYSDEFEKEYRHKDGHFVPVAVRIWLDRNEKGEAVGAWCIARDLSGLRAVEKNVARSDERYRLLAEYAEDVIWTVDNSFKYTYISPSVERLRGFTPDEVITRSFEESLTPESYVLVQQALAETLAAEARGEESGPKRLELELMHKDGSTLWAEIVARTLHGAEGQRIGFIGATRDISDRKKAERQLRESENTLRALLNATSDSVGMFSVDGDILTVNHEMASSSHMSMEEMLGKNFFDLPPVEVVPKRRSKFREAVESGQPVTMRDVRMGRIMDSVIYPIKGEGDEIVNVAVYARDVTDTILNEEARKQSEAQYRRIVDTANEGIVGLDAEGAITYANQNAIDFFGYELAELIGSPVRDLVHADELEDHKERLRHRNQGLRERYQQRFVRKDGSVVWGQVSGTPLLAEDGRYLGAFAMIADISEVKEAEGLLKESEERYRRIVETANEGVISIDEDHTITFANKVMGDMLGYTVEELIDSPVSMLVFPEDMEAQKQRLIQRRQGISDQSVRRYRHKNSHEVWMAVSSSPIFGDDGSYHGSLGMATDITERKKAEDALRLTQFSVDNAAIDIYWINSEGRIVYANDQACKNLGFSHEEMLNLSVPDINPSFQFEDWPEYLQERRQYELKHFEAVHQRKDGSSFPVGITSRYREYDGQEYLFCYSYDLSERERAENELRRSQDLLNEVQRISLTGGWEVDMVTGETHWTDGQFQLHGMNTDSSPADVKRFFERHVHPDDRKMLSEGWNTIMQEHVPVEMEYKAIRADGTQAIFMGVAIPDMDDEGNVRRVYGSTRDVTLERRSAVELEQAHERLLTILDGIDADIYVSGIDSNEILFMNAHMKEHFGTPAGGAHCYEMFRGESEQCSFCPKPLILDEEGNPVATLVNERFNPLTRRWYLNHDRAIAWLEGRLVHMHMAADITELKTMEEELKLAMAEAEAASLAKNEFLANMSHEIRTPLNGLLGMLQILQFTNLVEEQRNYLDTAFDSGRNLLRILNDILDLSKIESGKLELEESQFELGEVLDSVVGVFRHQAESRGLSITWKIDESLPRHFIGDKGRLRQILFNLVGNASKFTESGSVTVEAYPMPNLLKDGRVSIYFSVTDTGIGIPDDKVNRIFDPFTQVDGSFSRKYQGTGLGLGIVRRLVSLMGGTITVTGGEGEGVTIVFTVAAKQAEGAGSFQPARVVRKGDSGLSILVAEDERVNRTVIKRLLGKVGHDVTCVENGEAALEMLQSEVFDCVLMDIQMPGINGLDTTRAIRTNLNLDVPVIALTAHAMKGDRDRFMKAGMNGYVAKPFELGDLEKELTRVMAGSSDN